MTHKPDKPEKGAESASGKTVALPTRKLLDSLAAPEVAGDELGRVPLPSGWEISLDVTDGPQKGASFPVTRSRVLIGRAADITIDDPRVSRRHASLEVYGSACVLLKDLDSTNGTFVNGRRVQSAELQDGDEIRVGSSILSVTIGAPP